MKNPAEAPEVVHSRALRFLVIAQAEHGLALFWLWLVSLFFGLQLRQTNCVLKHCLISHFSKLTSNGLCNVPQMTLTR